MRLAIQICKTESGEPECLACIRGPMLEAGQKIYPANTPNKFAISKLTATWDIAMGSDKDSSKDRH